MLKTKIFLGAQFLEKLFNDCKLEPFFLKFEDFHFTLLQQKNIFEVEIFLELDLLSLYDDLGLYTVRSIISNFVDGDRHCFQVYKRNGSSKHNYYTISQFEEFPFKSISCSSTIEAFEIEVLKSCNVKLLSDSDQPISIIKINSYDREVNPILASITAVQIDLLFLEIFFEHYIKGEFPDDDEYVTFRQKYFAFYNKFEWGQWNPSLVPAPAHGVISTCLKTKHKLKKDDAYLLKWGYIMAILNGARFNRALTRANEHDKRVNDIFQAGLKKRNSIIFFSTDSENGQLEIYDYNGNHNNKVYGLENGVITQKRNYTIKVPESKWL
ncbi:hypothetical protein [Desertivirga xinjiangensis]|uniref:hypothetical protein n=1 Tax=Desertivirga xinjiangensis TaxID=539206 RepID=UPI00210DE4CA|nr:hypothetical protein [Pedobacter xinjiangensis]